MVMEWYGTNFVNVANDLQHLIAAEKVSMAVEIRSWLSTDNTTLQFIQPHVPNFTFTKFHLYT